MCGLLSHTPTRTRSSPSADSRREAGPLVCRYALVINLAPMGHTVGGGHFVPLPCRPRPFFTVNVTRSRLLSMDCRS